MTCRAAATATPPAVSHRGELAKRPSQSASSFGVVIGAPSRPCLQRPDRPGRGADPRPAEGTAGRVPRAGDTPLAAGSMDIDSVSGRLGERLDRRSRLTQDRHRDWQVVVNRPQASTRRPVDRTRPTGPSQSTFVQVSGQHSNALRSRVRRFESCWERFFEYLIESRRFARNAQTCENTNKIKPVRPMRGPDTAHGRIPAGWPCLSETVLQTVCADCYGHSASAKAGSDRANTARASGSVLPRGPAVWPGHRPWQPGCWP